MAGLPVTGRRSPTSDGMIGVVSVLSIQSSVAYGYVGNAAAVFTMQRLGLEVWPVPTVVFSNHAGYDAWRGRTLPADDVRELLRGIEERGVLPEVDVVLSGYQGGEDVGEVVLEAVAAVKAANPEAVYACDPVMGNAESGQYVHPAIPALMRERVVPAADLITPNQFELGLLTGTGPRTLSETLAAVDAVRALGPSTVLVTSVLPPDAPADTLEMVAVHGDEAWVVRTPRFPSKSHGSGDVTSALFTTHLTRTGDVRESLERTASSVFDLLRLTHDSGRWELQLVAAQQHLAEPAMQFRAQPA